MRGGILLYSENGWFFVLVHFETKLFIYVFIAVKTSDLAHSTEVGQMKKRNEDYYIKNCSQKNGHWSINESVIIKIWLINFIIGDMWMILNQIKGHNNRYWV
jgi:hypothetical protein